MSCNQIPAVAVRKVHPLAQLPFYATEGAAAADVCGVNEEAITIYPGQSVFIDTGLQFEVPRGYELKAYSRSGHGFKSGIRLANCTGILDSDYRGNLGVKLHNDSGVPYVLGPRERIVQIQVKKIPQSNFFWVDELTDTVRGEAGYGSTGK